jgi:hypothetical protein
MTLAEKQGREAVAERSGGVCEICHRSAATAWHHRKRRTQGGDWSVVNGLHLCAECHTKVHSAHEKDASYSYGWLVREHMDPANMPVYVRTADGWRYVWLCADGSMHEVDWSMDLAERLSDARDGSGGAA